MNFKPIELATDVAVSVALLAIVTFLSQWSRGALNECKKGKTTGDPIQIVVCYLIAATGACWMGALYLKLRVQMDHAASQALLDVLIDCCLRVTLWVLVLPQFVIAIFLMIRHTAFRISAATLQNTADRLDRVFKWLVAAAALYLPVAYSILSVKLFTRHEADTAIRVGLQAMFAMYALGIVIVAFRDDIPQLAGAVTAVQPPQKVEIVDGPDGPLTRLTGVVADCRRALSAPPAPSKVEVVSLPDGMVSGYVRVRSV